MTGFRVMPLERLRLQTFFDPATETFRTTIGQLQEPLLLHGATLLNDGTVLISGGFDAGQIVPPGVLGDAFDQLAGHRRGHALG